MGALKHVYVSRRELFVIDSDLFGKKIFANRSLGRLQIRMKYFIFYSCFVKYVRFEVEIGYIFLLVIAEISMTFKVFKYMTMKREM